jgi:SWI/SNF-related matrix-associated actin-dependent regulator of chromatin subfamily A3
LNTTISHCIQQLSWNISVRYEAFVSHNAWREAVQTWKESGKRGQLPVGVQVYGLRDATEDVGKVFSRARLYFQHPDYCDSSTTYENPHYLSFSNLTISEPPMFTSWNTSVYQAGRSSKCNISEVLEGLDQQQYVRQANIDPRVRTPLLWFVASLLLPIPLI